MKKQIFRISSDGFNGAWYPATAATFIWSKDPEKMRYAQIPLSMWLLFAKMIIEPSKAVI